MLTVRLLWLIECVFVAISVSQIAAVISSGKGTGAPMVKSCWCCSAAEVTPDLQCQPGHPGRMRPHDPATAAAHTLTLHSAGGSEISSVHLEPLLKWNKQAYSEFRFRGPFFSHAAG